VVAEAGFGSAFFADSFGDSFGVTLAASFAPVAFSLSEDVLSPLDDDPESFELYELFSFGRLSFL
jgi:hypothetical protein